MFAVLSCFRCFEAGTLVQTPDGLQAIETLEVGDLVLSYNDATGAIEPKPITALIRPLPKAVLDVEIADARGAVERIGVTADHPWLVRNAGGASVWLTTLDLKPGDQLVTADGAHATFRSATLRDAFAQTYNLEVADTHTFLVGEDGVVVHNCKWFNPRHVPPALRDDISRALEGLNSGAVGTPFRNWSGKLPASSGPFRKVPVGNPSTSPVRIVQGADGSRFITFDHYGTFQRIR